MAHGLTQEFSRILVARGGAIGDFILTLPVFQALRLRYPSCFIEVLGYPHIASLATLDRHVDRISRIESLAFTPLFTPAVEISQLTRDYFSSFDLIISYIHDSDGYFQKRVSEISSAKFLTGPGRPNQTSTSHATEVLLRPLQEIGLFTTDHEPRLLRNPALQDASVAQTSELDAALPSGLVARSAPAAKWMIACHPGSSHSAKNWPIEKWSELLSWLIEESPARLVVLGGEADGARIEKLKKVLPPACYELWENLALTDLAHQLRQCRGFVGHDSGISHLAAALGIPTTVLWGATNSDVWRPMGSHVRLVFAEEGLENLTVEAVSAEVGHLFDDFDPHRAVI